MLRIILRGRTGNILFQYALGRALAARHGMTLLLDASWYNSAGWAEVSHLLKLPLKAKVVRRFSLGARALHKLTHKHYWEYRNVPVLKEAGDDSSFDPKFLDAPADCVLYGYFQTPRYFETVAEDLRREINGLLTRAFEGGSGQDARATVVLPFCPPTLFQKTSQPNSVAVHVRRGDYLKLPLFHVCDAAYYHESMAEMRARVPDARFFIFSDDPAWCCGEFRDPDTEVIKSANSAANPLHDLYLMSLASHHIIANSSFSWWAAWLGDKPEQQVIMPARWYAGLINAPMEEKRWK